MRLSLLTVAVCVCALIGTTASAQDEYEWESDLIHSGLPLYTFEWKDVWPRHFSGGEGDTFTFGCSSRVGFGDWQFIPNPDNEYGEPYWYRVSNYGVFHCAANLLSADSREELDEGDFSRGLFVQIGKARADGKDWELWALRKGFIPGSSYTLLARETGDEDGIVEEFRVLQRRCPPGKLREARGMDVWLTRYCAVDSKAELLALARRMLREQPLGTFLRAEDEKGPDTEAPDPQNPQQLD